MTNVSMVFVTVGKEEEASQMGRTLLEEGLIACANIIPGIRSIYRWKGEVCDEREFLMIMKTRTSLVPALKGRVRELHSYEVPEIVSFPIEQGLQEYLEWVLQNTRE
jgi:periplasmic divalent cation tolerance protein